MAEKERSFGLDALRVVSMLGIVGLHALGAGAIISGADLANDRAGKLVAELLKQLFLCSVNIFAMLSGYLYIKKDRVRRAAAVRLTLTTFFWCAVILVAAVFLLPQSLTSPTSYLNALFPPLIGRYWYITCYILMFFLMPYLNTAVRALTKKQLLSLLCVLFIALSLLTTFFFNDFFKIDGGYSPFWLIFCYLAGAYLSLYGLPLRPGRLASCGLIALNTALGAFCHFALRRWLPGLDEGVFGLYTSPFVFANAVLALHLFSGIGNPRCATLRSICAGLSNAAFGVYIIHSHWIIFQYVLTARYGSFGMRGVAVLTASALFIPPAIFLVCAVPELLRARLFRLCGIDRLTARFGAWLDKLMD